MSRNQGCILFEQKETTKITKRMVRVDLDALEPLLPANVWSSGCQRDPSVVLSRAHDLHQVTDLIIDFARLGDGVGNFLA